jgi:hypothetical protein
LWESVTIFSTENNLTGLTAIRFEPTPSRRPKISIFAAISKSRSLRIERRGIRIQVGDKLGRHLGIAKLKLGKWYVVLDNLFRVITEVQFFLYIKHSER